MRGGIFEKTSKGFEATRRVMRIWRVRHAQWPQGAVSQVIYVDGRARFLSREEQKRPRLEKLPEWPEGATGLVIHEDGRPEFLFRYEWDRARARHDRWSDGEPREIA